MKKLIALLLLTFSLLGVSACSFGANTTNVNGVESIQDGPSATGPDTLPDLHGPLKPPTE